MTFKPSPTGETPSVSSEGVNWAPGARSIHNEPLPKPLDPTVQGQLVTNRSQGHGVRQDDSPLVIQYLRRIGQ